MNADHVFRALARLEADRAGVSYDDRVAEEVGTDLRRVLLHYDRRAAFRAYRKNLRERRVQHPSRRDEMTRPRS